RRSAQEGESPSREQRPSRELRALREIREARAAAGDQDAIEARQNDAGDPSHAYVAADLPVNILRQFPDDAEKLRPGDRPLLVIENDSIFAEILMDAAHDHGLKVLVATRGAAGVAMARDFMPQSITLDLNLPDIDGWRVLDRLKNDPATRHIPVFIITTDEERERGLRMGAAGVATKPFKTRDALDETFAKIKEFTARNDRNLLIVHPAEG